MTFSGIIFIFIIGTIAVMGFLFYVGFLLLALFINTDNGKKGWKTMIDKLSEKAIILAMLGALILALVFAIYREYQCRVNSINCSTGGGAPDYDYDPLHPMPQPQ